MTFRLWLITTWFLYVILVALYYVGVGGFTVNFWVATFGLLTVALVSTVIAVKNREMWDLPKKEKKGSE